ncbi:MAG TPA: hypothetical protein VIH61_00125 [Waddliaceae bacterium]
MKIKILFATLFVLSLRGAAIGEDRNEEVLTLPTIEADKYVVKNE